MCVKALPHLECMRLEGREEGRSTSSYINPQLVTANVNVLISLAPEPHYPQITASLFKYGLIEFPTEIFLSGFFPRPLWTFVLPLALIYTHERS